MNHVESLDLEISNYCNAKCSSCTREFTNNLNNSNLDINFFKEFINYQEFPNLKKIRFCGNIGDPLTNKDIIKIVEHVKTDWKKCYVDIRTNGGLSTTKVWSKLGTILNDKDAGAIWFGIDGDSTTNHLYRKNVVWNVLTKNLNSFIRNGGRAIFQFIVFPWNSHQLHDMISFAADSGFKKFVTRISKRSEETTMYFQSSIDILTNLNYKIQKLEPLTDLPLECYSLLRKELYISSTKKIYPCCILGNNENVFKDDIFSSIVNDKNFQKNDLRYSNFSNIYSNTIIPVYEKLNTETPCLKCKKSCTRRNDKRDWFILIDFDSRKIYYDHGYMIKENTVFL